MGPGPCWTGLETIRTSDDWLDYNVHFSLRLEIEKDFFLAVYCDRTDARDDSMHYSSRFTKTIFLKGRGDTTQWRRPSTYPDHHPNSSRTRTQLIAIRVLTLKYYSAYYSACYSAYYSAHYQTARHIIIRGQQG